MIGRFFLIVFLLVLQVYSGSAQTKQSMSLGYEIILNTENNQGKSLVLSYSPGTTNGLVAIDTFYISGNHNAIKMGKVERIVPAIYRLSWLEGNKDDYAEIEINNGVKIKASLKGALDSIKFNDSLNILIQIKNNNPRGTVIREYAYDRIKKKYPHSVAALTLKLEDRVLRMKKDALTWKADVKINYLDSIDMDDKRMVLLPNMYSFLNNYFSHGEISDTVYYRKASQLLSSLNCTKDRYAFYLNWLFKNITYHEKYNLDNTYIKLYDEFANKKGCKSLSNSQLNKLANHVELARSMPADKKVLDFELIDTTGTCYTLYKELPKTKYTLLVFWDPDCHHCRERLPLINVFIEGLPKNKASNFQAISILNTDTDTKWRSFIADNQLKKWLHLQQDCPENTFRSDFKAFGNPMYYLLNNQGNIVSRTQNLRLISEIIEH